MGDSKKSVPDSCCLFEAPGCGQNLFEITDIRVIVQKINIHGCLFVMKRRLDTHVTVILMVFAGSASILAMVELLSVVLACCLSSSFSRNGLDDDCPVTGGPVQYSLRWRWAYYKLSLYSQFFFWSFTCKFCFFDVPFLVDLQVPFICAIIAENMKMMIDNTILLVRANVCNFLLEMVDIFFMMYKVDEYNYKWFPVYPFLRILKPQGRRTF